MGSINNVKVRKPHGAKSLAEQHKRSRPKSVKSNLNCTVSNKKLNHKKAKKLQRAKVGSA